MKKVTNLLFLVILLISLINLGIGYTITLKPIVNETTGEIQLTYYNAITVILGLYTPDLSPATLWGKVIEYVWGFLVLLAPAFGLIFSLIGNKLLQTLTAYLLILFHVIACAEVIFRTGMMDYNLDGVAAYAVFNVNYFVTLICSLLLAFFLSRELKKTGRTTLSLV